MGPVGEGVLRPKSRTEDEKARKHEAAGVFNSLLEIGISRDALFFFVQAP
jgi:hypothetical protein